MKMHVIYITASIMNGSSISKIPARLVKLRIMNSPTHSESDSDSDSDLSDDGRSWSPEKMYIFAYDLACKKTDPQTARQRAVCAILDTIGIPTRNVVLRVVKALCNMHDMNVTCEVLRWLHGGDNVYTAETFVNDAGGDPAVLKNMPTAHSTVWMFAHRLHIKTVDQVLMDALHIGDFGIVARLIATCPPTYDSDLVNRIIAICDVKDPISRVYEVALKKGTPFEWTKCVCGLARDKESPEVYDWIHSLPLEDQPCGGTCLKTDIDE